MQNTNKNDVINRGWGVKSVQILQSADQTAHLVLADEFTNCVGMLVHFFMPLLCHISQDCQDTWKLTLHPFIKLFV